MQCMSARTVVGLVLLLVSACTSMPVPHVEPVPFRSTQASFDGDDRIEIDEVLAEDKTLHRPGAEVRVRGHYRLASQAQAWLCFGLTGGDVQGDMWRSIQRGNGKFEFTAHVIRPGQPHVSLFSGDGAYNCIGNHAFEVRGAAP
jgi:hypothetical protein